MGISVSSNTVAETRCWFSTVAVTAKSTSSGSKLGPPNKSDPFFYLPCSPLIIATDDAVTPTHITLRPFFKFYSFSLQFIFLS